MFKYFYRRLSNKEYTGAYSAPARAAMRVDGEERFGGGVGGGRKPADSCAGARIVSLPHAFRGPIIAHAVLEMKTVLDAASREMAVLALVLVCGYMLLWSGVIREIEEALGM